jgi:hypothetical protein
VAPFPCGNKTCERVTETIVTSFLISDDRLETVSALA